MSIRISIQIYPYKKYNIYKNFINIMSITKLSRKTTTDPCYTKGYNKDYPVLQRRNYLFSAPALAPPLSTISASAPATAISGGPAPAPKFWIWTPKIIYLTFG